MVQTTSLSAVVVGAGWAGEGHARALRQVGVDVVALCARDADTMRAVAERLAIAEASINWRETITRLRPDIVTIATPASLRAEVVELAAALGCHVFCEKPLALNAAEARRLVRVVHEAGVKHAIGHTHAAHPTVRWVGELVRDGAIGPLRSVEFAFHAGPLLSALSPWTWFDSLELGGGLLNNTANHWLAMLEAMTGLRTRRVVGVAHRGRERAPVLPGLHDARTFTKQVVAEHDAPSLEWRTCDADMAFSALVELSGPNAPTRAGIIGHLTATVMGPMVWPPDGWRLRGETGVLLVDEAFAPVSAYRQRAGESTREPLPVSGRLLASLANSGDALVDMWTILFQAFVADIRGETHSSYPTFRDDYRLQTALDAIQGGSGWTEIPDAALGSG